MIDEAFFNIVDSDAEDLKTLAKIAGFKPDNFFRGANLSDVDLRGQDLSGIDFGMSNIEKARLDNNAIIRWINNSKKSCFVELKSKDARRSIKVSVYIPRRFDSVIWKTDNTLRYGGYGITYGRLLGVGLRVAMENPDKLSKYIHAAVSALRYQKTTSVKRSIILKNDVFSGAIFFKEYWILPQHAAHLAMIIIGIRKVYGIKPEQLLSRNPLQLSLPFEFDDEVDPVEPIRRYNTRRLRGQRVLIKKKRAR